MEEHETNVFIILILLRKRGIDNAKKDYEFGSSIILGMDNFQLC